MTHCNGRAVRVSKLPLLPCFFMILIVSGSIPACEDDLIDAKLQKAKTQYKEANEEQTAAILDLLDKRKEAAVKAGNKDALDQSIKERQFFEKYGDLPSSTSIGLMQRQGKIESTLLSAYRNTIREYTKKERAQDASRVTSEMDLFETQLEVRFTRRILLGKWHVQMGDYTAEYTFFPDGRCLHASTSELKLEWTIDMTAKRIITHGIGDRDSVTDEITLPLDPKSTTGVNFRGNRFVIKKK